MRSAPAIHLFLEGDYARRRLELKDDRDALAAAARAFRVLDFEPPSWLRSAKQRKDNSAKPRVERFELGRDLAPTPRVSAIAAA